MIYTGELVPFMKAEMFGIQKSAMLLSFSGFTFLPIYKADSAGSRTYPFGHRKTQFRPYNWRFTSLNDNFNDSNSLIFFTWQGGATFEFA